MPMPFSLRPRLLACTAALLAGCSAVSEHPTPGVAAPAVADWHALASETSSAPLDDPWWRLYQDPQLDQLVTRALANNLDLRAALARVDEHLAVLGQRQASRWPDTRLSWQSSYGRSSDDQTEARARDQRAASQWSHGPAFALAYQIDLWGQVRQSILAARAHAEAAQAAHDQLRVAVAASTTRAYASACAYAARALIQQHSLETLRQSLELTERQQRAGLATDLQVERLRSLLEETRASLPPLRAEQQAAREELAVLVGADSDSLPATVSTCSRVPQLARPLPVGDGWALLQRRADIRQARRELEAASHEVGVRQADYYPSVSFGVSLASSAQHLGDLGEHQAITYGVGPLISWRFPNVLATRARLDGAEARERQLLARFQQQALVALKDVRQSLLRYSGERQHRDALLAALDSGRKAYGLAVIKQRAGAIDFLELLDSERALVGLEADKAEADRQLMERQIDLFQALGGGWQQPDVQQAANAKETAR